MITIKGQFNTATVMTDLTDEATINQIYGLLNQRSFEGTKIAIMPDCHAGVGTVVGFTMRMNDLIIPNIIGVDIGCGIDAYRIGKEQIDFSALDKHIRKTVPSGFHKHKESVVRDYEEGYFSRDFEGSLKGAIETIELLTEDVMNSIGTLGGGNHFMEIDKDEEGNLWFVIHTGSRNFGLQVAHFFQKRAKDWVGKNRMGEEIPKNLEYLPMNEGGDEYLRHMQIAQTYAAINRRMIAKAILEGFFGINIDKTPSVKSVHNYINFADKIIRKGAISAHQDERVIIPLNMRDGSIIARGKGNAAWNFSAPHGAGRKMSRGKAMETLKLSDYEKSMEGIWSSCVHKNTLDEAPQAYKDPKTILASINETVDIELVMKPVYNFKAPN